MDLVDTSISAIEEGVELLTQYAHEDLRLLFYPSCGRRIRPVYELDYDVFVFSDYGAGRMTLNSITKSEQPEHSYDCRVVHPRPGKVGLRFDMDNNDVLEIINQSGLKISAFVGVNDGCCEGGNYQCVNEGEFFSGVTKQIADEGMLYITDHSYNLTGFLHGGHTRSEPRSHYGSSGMDIQLRGPHTSAIEFSSYGPVYEFWVTRTEKATETPEDSSSS